MPDVIRCFVARAEVSRVPRIVPRSHAATAYARTRRRCATRRVASVQFRQSRAASCRSSGTDRRPFASTGRARVRLRHRPSVV